MYTYTVIGPRKSGELEVKGIFPSLRNAQKMVHSFNDVVVDSHFMILRDDSKQMSLYDVGFIEYPESDDFDDIGFSTPKTHPDIYFGVK
jgi:hypothetical protein